MPNIYMAPKDADELEIWTKQITIHLKHRNEDFSFRDSYIYNIQDLKQSSYPQFIICRQKALSSIFKRAVTIYKALKYKDYSLLNEIDRNFYLDDNEKSDNIIDFVFHDDSPLMQELEDYDQRW